MKNEFHSETDSFMARFLVPVAAGMAIVSCSFCLCGMIEWYFAPLFAAIAWFGIFVRLCEAGMFNPRIFLLPFAALFELALMVAALLLSHIDCRRALVIADWATLHLPDTRWYTRKRGAK